MIGPLIQEFNVTKQGLKRSKLVHEFSPKLETNRGTKIISEFTSTYIHRIRIREVTQIGVINPVVENLILHHPDEPISLSGFTFDPTDLSFIVEKEFGFDPDLLRVDYSLYGFIEGAGYRYWTYKDQIPEIIWG